jgi:DICT domain-containing protein
MAEVTTLTIGELAELSGVAAGTLRMWESRHGFPRPQRLPSGHRRYRAADVDLIRQVVRERATGLSLRAAVERVLSSAVGPPSSIFAGLRRRWPELRVHRLDKRGLTAVSVAIEDEYRLSAERGLIVGSFQRASFYRAVAGRWRELARQADASFVLAQFRGRGQRDAPPQEVAIGSRDALAREWAVVCDAPGFAACACGLEAAESPRPDPARRFDAIWSFDPMVVRAAAEIAIEIAAGREPRIERSARTAISHEPGAGAPEQAIATSERMVGYLARRLSRSAPEAGRG